VDLFVFEMFIVTGAFYRWLFSFGRKPYRYFYDQDGLSRTIGVVVMTLIMVSVGVIKIYHTKNPS